MQNKYIGGNFASTDLNNYLIDYSQDEYDEYFPKKINKLTRAFFETGADALSSIIEELHSKDITIHFPRNYCEETITRVKLKTNISLHRKYNSIEDIEFSTDNSNVLILLHFNGYDEAIESHIENLRHFKELIIIEDYVHAPFEISKFTGDYAFNSLRKICSIDVAVAYKKEQTRNKKLESDYNILRSEAENLKSDFLKNGNNSIENKYLDLFRKAELSLMHNVIQSASENEIKKMLTVDFNKIKNVRLENAKYLISYLKKNSQFEILRSDYLFVIVKCSRRDELRNYLSNQGVFAPVHWTDSNSELSKKILSLPIDQRYNMIDMNFLADLVNHFYL